MEVRCTMSQSLALTKRAGKTCLCEGPGFDPQEYQPVTPAVPYLSTGLAGCSVGPRISCAARKLARIPRVIKIIIIKK